MTLPGVYDIFNKQWADKQTCWIISDTHFGDEELRQGMPGRPSDDELVARINSFVGRKDVLILLGDCGDPEYVKKLRGYKVLIAGNHERAKSEMVEVVDEYYEGPLMLGEKLLLSHEPVMVPWAFNIHGHDHAKAASDKFHLNMCCDVCGYTPLHLNKFLKGGLAHITTIHRTTIDRATVKKKMRRGSKK